MTLAPGLIFGNLLSYIRANKPAMSADVPEFTATANLVPIYFAHSLSNCFVNLPSDILPESRTLLIAYFSSLPIIKSPTGIFIMSDL